MSTATSQRAPDAIDLEVGKRVRDMRRSRRVTQPGLARLIERSVQQLRKYEAGENRIPVSMLVRIARALEVAPGVLLPDRDEGATPAVADADADALLAAYARLRSRKLRAAMLRLVEDLSPRRRRAAR